MAEPVSAPTDAAHAPTATAHEGPADPDLRYRMWRLAHMPLKADLYRQRLASLAMTYRPTVSIVTPVFDTPPEILDRMLRSVANQTYPFWQHCLVDDGSTSDWLAGYLERLASRDPRIRFERRATNGGIVAASNHALAMATGEFISMLDHDDELDPQALYAVASRLNADPETDVFYSDFDLLDRGGRHSCGWFLPGWSPELLLSLPLVTHLTVYRRALVELIGGWRAGYEGSQDYDLALRAFSVTSKFLHIPQVLYHWRQWERSVAANPTAKPYAYVAAKDAVVDHLLRNGIAGRREDGAYIGFHAVRHDILGSPLVSVIVHASAAVGAAGAPECVAGLRRFVAQGNYGHVELVVVVEADAQQVYESVQQDDTIPCRIVVHRSAEDTAEHFNTGAAASRGDHLLFLGAAFGLGAPGWLSALLEFSQQEPIGAVGARILRHDGAFWHTGVVLPRGVPHVLTVESLLVNCSAVSGACLMTRRSTFEQAGGFRPSAVVGHADFDYCLRLRELGYRHLVTPHAVVQFNGPPPDDVSAIDRQKFIDTWAARMHVDPYYNPNFCQEHACFTLTLG
ncbi:MAG TPA: glycosyltransferase [Vicinamibacterales bacterium]|nr:glycosyltransferase [Vicinamibacterales bacterium]